MTQITDEYMQQMRASMKPYTIVILKAGNMGKDGAQQTIWEHARKNFALRQEGKVAIVCPVMDGTDMCGLYIFNTPPEETTSIMQEDPAVKDGIFTFEVHPTASFEGDKLG